jgi:hypothetical protein
VEITYARAEGPSYIVIVEGTVDNDDLRADIAKACKDLEADMWSRTGHHADTADFQVVIERTIREWENKHQCQICRLPKQWFW